MNTCGNESKSVVEEKRLPSASPENLEVTHGPLYGISMLLLPLLRPPMPTLSTPTLFLTHHSSSSLARMSSISMAAKGPCSSSANFNNPSRTSPARPTRDASHGQSSLSLDVRRTNRLGRGILR